MKLAYFFSREEIVAHDISNFEAFFGLNRLKAVTKGKPSVAGALLGSMKVFFDLDGDTQPHEDADIRTICALLIEKTPIVFLATIEDKTMNMLFFTTLPHFTAAEFTEVPGRIRFECDRNVAQEHFSVFQEKILTFADKLGVPPVHSIEHVSAMSQRLWTPQG